MIPKIWGKRNLIKSRQLHVNSRSLRVRNRKSSYSLFHQCSTCRFLLFVAIFLFTGLFLFHHNDLVMKFLEGPSVPIEPEQFEQRGRRPEDPRPETRSIFLAQSRQDQNALTSMRNMFQRLRDSNQLIECRLDKGDCTASSSLFFRHSKPVVLRNTLQENRYFCGEMIRGNGGTLEFETFPSNCQSPMPYLLTPKPPLLSGKEANPIELYWNVFVRYDDTIEDVMEDHERQTRPFKCPIPCRTAGDYDILSTISVKDTSWSITISMEGEQYYSQTRVRPKGYLHDQYYAVSSFKAEIPMPYFSWAEYQIQHPAVDFDRVIKGASFLANNCDSLSDRESLVKALLETRLRVDSLSACLNNAQPPPRVDMGNKTAILEQYLFHLAFENQRADDYITEKLWGTLASGTLPVYFGAPNIKEHVPPNSVIFVDDYETPRDLANYLIKLTKDKALYESYHSWRYSRVDPEFEQKYDFTKTHSTCRICKWAYAKKHGLEWNHTAQEVQQSHIARKTCLNKMGLVGHPVKEYWLSGSTGKAVSVQSNNAKKTCSVNNSNRVLEIDGGKFHRKVYDQDGVTDLIIQDKEGGGYILRLETPIVSDNLEKIGESDAEYWFQDSQSRITILISENVPVFMSKKGTVDIPIPSDLQVRIIVENIDKFHKGAKKHASYFGDLMKRDFVNPLEAYRIK